MVRHFNVLIYDRVKIKKSKLSNFCEGTQLQNFTKVSLHCFENCGSSVVKFSLAQGPIYESEKKNH